MCPCRYCRKTTNLVRDKSSSGRYYIMCTTCEVTMFGDTEQIVRDRWNDGFWSNPDFLQEDYSPGDIIDNRSRRNRHSRKYDKRRNKEIES
jgi:hypothetical protein